MSDPTESLLNLQSLIKRIHMSTPVILEIKSKIYQNTKTFKNFYFLKCKPNIC